MMSWLKFSLIKLVRGIFLNYLCMNFKCNNSRNFWIGFTSWKVSKYGVIYGPYFLVFGLNTEIYPVNLRILSGYRKIKENKHFSRSAFYFNSILFMVQVFFDLFYFYVSPHILLSQFTTLRCPNSGGVHLLITRFFIYKELHSWG